MAVHARLFQEHMTRAQLATHLKVSGSVAGRKLRGIVSWSASDVMVAASALGVDASALLPIQLSDGSYAPQYTTRDLNPEPAD